MIRITTVILITTLLEHTTSWEFSSKSLCKENDANLTQITTKGEEGTIHFLFSADFHVRPPVALILYSPLPESVVEVNCTRYVSEDPSLFRQSVTASAVTSSYGVLFYQFYDYPDFADTVDVPTDKTSPRYLGSNLDWNLKQFEDISDRLVIRFSGTQLNESRDKFLPGGKIDIRFTIYKKNMTPSDANYYTMQAGINLETRIIIDRLHPQFTQTRVAPVIFLFSDRSMEDDDDFVVKTAYPLNAYTGPFGQLTSTYVILSERNKYPEKHHTRYIPGFVQFPPVACVEEHCVKTSLVSARLGARVYLKHRKTAKKYSHTLAYAYYGDKFDQVHNRTHQGFVGLRVQYVNLGSPKDGFYGRTHYLSWTFVTGLGEPRFQTFFKGSVAAGVIIPLIFCVTLATGFLCWRRHGYPRFWSKGRSVRLEEQAVHLSTTEDEKSIVESSQMPKLNFEPRAPPTLPDSPSTSRDPLVTFDPPSYGSIVSLTAEHRPV
ncbi:unnamed protein product [Calicophoron daubneyi]|uniref:Uncharacterized protein n=1 Tax=Calicophoron daubneyi TaxID=300641 RepID=A0AAV2T131_CALDB